MEKLEDSAGDGRARDREQQGDREEEEQKGEEEEDEEEVNSGCDDTNTTTESCEGAKERRREGRRAEGTEDDEDEEDEFGGVNPTRDALQEGLLGLLRPTVDALDARVSDTRAAQEELRAQIAALQSDVADIAASADTSARAGVDLEAAVEKLNAAKRRVVVVANLLQAAQDRLNRVHQNCLKETARRRTQLEPNPAAEPSPPPPSSSSAATSSVVGVSVLPK